MQTLYDSLAPSNRNGFVFIVRRVRAPGWIQQRISGVSGVLRELRNSELHQRSLVELRQVIADLTPSWDELHENVFVGSDPRVLIERSGCDLVPKDCVIESTVQPVHVADGGDAVGKEEAERRIGVTS